MKFFFISDFVVPFPPNTPSYNEKIGGFLSDLKIKPPQNPTFITLGKGIKNFSGYF